MPEEHSSWSCGITVRLVSTKCEDGKYQLSAIVNDEQPPINICRTEQLTVQELETMCEALEKNITQATRATLDLMAQEFSNPLFAFLARRFCDR